ncbi:DNRLRE domain-containing protein [Nonomuraea muscovyensis]|uniref:DNRLRE domain-containing protein n=1 Tax=Nonomuraea muscovyensis TaxID=1124761 RepID=UPI00340C317E
MTLVFTPDAAFLADPTTIYPVTMAAAASDWYEGHTGEVSEGGMDTWINDYDYQDSWDTFYQTQIVVGKSYASSIAKRWRGYLKFPTIPAEFAGSKVDNADLHLWNYQSNECGEFVGSGITARRILSDWNDTRLLWSSQPSVTSLGADTEYGAYSEDCTGSMNYPWNLTHTLNGIVQEWIDGATNYGIQLTAGDESELRNWRRYTSEDAGGCMTQPLEACKFQQHPPILTVDFAPPRHRAVFATLKDPGEAAPSTGIELQQWAANGRVSNELPEPDPITNAQDQEYRESSDQDSSTPSDDLDEPLPAPADDIAARWSYSEGSGTTAADGSGHGHDATVNDGTTWTPGVSDSALTNIGVAPGSAPKPTSALPARVAAMNEAVARGAQVEVREETTETSITFADPARRAFTTKVSAAPVRTRRDGVWIPIDTSLVEHDGKLTPKVLADGAVVEISAGGTDPFVKMSADGKSYALRWPTPLPKPVVKGSVATYTDAAGVGADLAVTALPTGFRHEVVLLQRPSKPLELRIGVDDEGLTLTEGKGGRLLLKGKDKKLVAAGTRPVVSDGSGKGLLAKRGTAGMDMVTGDGRTDLVVRPDQAVLADAGTTYPVRVAAAVTLPVATDVDVSSFDVDSPGYPASGSLMAGTRTDGTKVRAHLRFDIPGLQGSTVTDAKLSMNTIDAHNCGAALTNGIQVARLTSTWDPAALYWPTKPTLTTEDASTNFKGVNQDCATWPDSMEWNVTGIAQDWADGAANHGLVLKSPGEANIDNYRVFTSSEDTDFGQPPTLILTTSGPASQPAVSAPAITPAQTVDGVTVTGSLTPQLAATVADTIGGSLTGEFEVEHDPAAPAGQGSGQIWTGTSPEVTSSGQATVSVPAGKLADGWRVRWRVRAVNAAASTTSAWSDWQSATVDVPNPTVGALQVTPSQVVDGGTVATSLTPGLRATVTDPAAQPLRAEFEIEHDPAAPAGQGSGQIWAGAADNVASGTQATATVPGGKLSDGWKVRWRARAINTATTIGSPWSDWQGLTIDVPDPGSEPAVGVLQVTPSEQVDGATVTPTLTPALLAQVNDPAAKPLRAEFELEHDPAAPEQGTGQIWTGGLDDVPAGTQATATVPGGKLSDGWKVRWRARAVSATAASAWSDWQSFTVDLPKPTVTGLATNPSRVVDGVTVTTTLTPQLQAVLTHPTDAAMRAEVEIEHDPAATGQGTGQIWTGGLDNVASGTQATVAIPGGQLTDGWKIRWRLRAVAADASSAWSSWQGVTVDLPEPLGGPLAQTTGPVVSTDQSFTVAAWVKWSDADGAYTIVDQKGAITVPFRLGNDPAQGLTFTFTSADQANPTIAGVYSGVKAPANEWFHIAGVYTASSSTATLYLNGGEIGSAALGFPAWKASGPMSLGTAIAGTLDETWVYNRDLVPEEVFALYDASGAAPAELKATSTASVTDRITPEDCAKDYGTGRRTHGLMKNRFSGCIKHEVEAIDSASIWDSIPRGSIGPQRVADDDRDAYNWKADVMFIARTFSGGEGLETGATTRDMMFDFYLGNVDDQGDVSMLGSTLTIGMSPARGQTACKHITTFNGSRQQNHVAKLVTEWNQVARKDGQPWSKIATFRFRADPADAPATRTDRSGQVSNTEDKISNCNMQPYVEISRPNDIDQTVVYNYGTSERDIKIKCDNASYIAARSGGCTLAITPSIEWKLGAGYDLAYYHYWKACYDKADTFPKQVNKTIVGCAVNNSGRPDKSQFLWRVGDPRQKNNNARAVTRCRSLWPRLVTDPDPRECDEYPFASAGNRTSGEDAARNFSVCAMGAGAWEPNQVAGKKLKRLYDRDRILREDHYFNRFATSPNPIPPMTDVCWKPINTSSTYYNQP